MKHQTVKRAMVFALHECSPAFWGSRSNQDTSFGFYFYSFAIDDFLCGEWDTRTF